ncbi:hypothetical protein JCM11641_007035 [Rhodosporidiobolus odoratus]
MEGMPLPADSSAGLVRQPSPSLSPSIASLLSATQDTRSTNYDPQDYFSPSAAPTQLPEQLEEAFGAGTRRPSPSPQLPQPVFTNLSQPDTAYQPADHPETIDRHPAHPGGPTATRPQSSQKRPRPTSSGSHTSHTSSTDGHNGRTLGNSVEEEEEGAMEPPTSRIRRSSSTSSASTPVPPPPVPVNAHTPASRATATPPQPSAVPPKRPGELPLEPSVFNIEPIDEFTREVADWLWGFCAGLDWDKVEIEAKIGLLVDSRGGGSRVYLPVPIETILTETDGLRFQSNMTVNQHKSFNRLLNSRVEESAAPTYPHAPVRYAHTREIDTFHTAPSSSTGKVRVTTNQKDRSRRKAVEKVRVADMNIFSPKRMFDWRVSVSLENPAPIPDTPPTHTRYKDRISYTHQLFTVDLTQVTSAQAASQNPNRPQAPQAPPTHELEIEYRNARPLLEEAAKEQRGEENRYLDMVQGLLNNVRMLIRNASEP